MVDVALDNKEWAEHWWPSPAKLNLMLNISGQRAGGYHELQTVFQLIAISDWLNFTPVNTGDIELSCSSKALSNDDNLVLRAAKLLQQHSACRVGAKIVLKKILPMGAGLGGGSSNAATTLVVLNKVWNLGYTTQTLANLGRTLGADVPVFIVGKSAWAEGIGDEITPMQLPEKWFVVVNSGHHCSTRDVFTHKSLTRDNPAITIRDFLDGQVQNVCLPVVREMNRELDDIYIQFSRFSTVYMTGTGSSMFAKCDTRQEAVALLEQLPESWGKWVVKGLNESPLQKSLKQFYI
ncbi:MAG TPA: 4-(cytidine 5'-diphospho)-2-C-methyl-D-erythritol kinase [Cycloclasticus sp.]|jgi:4-diphosphocytidyl-2-C-methyl-D-erythritol kinase|nr:4-(cytidine 5'-diphospho)-2-C-methyl-D-erythritol kinase [Cycloclasticus sp.]HIL92775.1 4-(cytidine 5'-diphospho)-2-C-methyl-D-erythritol kinase [Cycloclasticus sp.]